MFTLTSKERAGFRKAANGLNPVFQVGKDGIDEELVKATANCLAARELIKLRVLETSPHTPREAAEELAEATGAEVIQVIGWVFVLYKKQTAKKAKPKKHSVPNQKVKAQAAREKRRQLAEKLAGKPRRNFGRTSR